MNVIVDTPIWSDVLRRRKRGVSPFARDVQELIDEGRVVMFGPVRQELLSGIRGQQQFETLRGILRAFPDHELVTQDFEKAAECFNDCRRRGIQGSNTDFLICAVALRNKFEIFTGDKDFIGFSRVLALHLYEQRFSE